jgi:TonB-dependent receptor
MSSDLSGSDTASWIWQTRRDYPFMTRPGESRLYGFTLGEVRARDFNIQRDRLGLSARLEFRWNEQHTFFAAISHNKFEDTEIEQVFARRVSGVAADYSGIKRITVDLLRRLGQDPEDPFNKQRLGALGLAASLTYNEAIALGEIAYDPELKLFTRGGAWPMPMDRTFIHTIRQDQIDTHQYGGKHSFAGELTADWMMYASKATQDSEQHWLRFYVDGATGLGAAPVAGVANPYIQDLSESQVIYDKSSFFLREYGSGGRGRMYNTFNSEDDRSGFELNLQKKFATGSATFTTRGGYALDTRDKNYKVNNNSYGLLAPDNRGRPSSLDYSIWPLGRMSLADALFDGGELPGFEKNYGPMHRYGPSFHAENTLAFLRDPLAYGANFVQESSHINNNFTSRVTTNYEATEDISGLYLMQTLDWGAWSFIVGARREETKNNFTNLRILTRNPDYPLLTYITPTLWKSLSENFGEIFAESVTTRRSYDHLLPAAHVIRRFGDRAILRASVTKTIARPLFSDLVPREVPEISGGNFGTLGDMSVQLPAFDLMPMESVNYDISLDYFIKPVGIISVALFYKDLDGPIYDEVRLGVGPDDETRIYELIYNSRNAALDPDNLPPNANVVNNRPYTFSRKRNAGKGNLRGVELTFDRKFNFLPGFLNGFGINSNISFFDSEATLLTQLRMNEKVRLFKQPDKTANLSIYYEKYGLFARLSYNLRGEYLNSITAGKDLIEDLVDIGVPFSSMDIYVAETTRLDFTMRYKITPSMQIFFEAINLTNEPEFRFRGHPSRQMSREYNERIFTVGMKWNL